MKITEGLSLLQNVKPATGPKSGMSAVQDSTSSFGSMLNNAITDVNGLQQQANVAVDKLVTGQATDLHEVMISVEKARTSFDLLMEIRNKTVDMYREIMRTPV
ncbi:MAG: flagellar hook-basal body complex protein FliE [Ignavibacteriales bacterium]|nr:flagellar hook-basal body complex protein FliE [Ignavibacteriales bacterium]